MKLSIKIVSGGGPRGRINVEQRCKDRFSRFINSDIDAK